MRKLVFTWMIFLAGWATAFSQETKEILYFVDFYNFFDNTGKPYTEMCLHIDASTLTYELAENQKYQGAVVIKLQVRKKLDETTVYEKSIELLTGDVDGLSPAYLKFFLTDIRRFGLAPGDYVITGTLTDKYLENAPEHKFMRDLIVEGSSPNFISFSDIQFISEYSDATTELPWTKYGKNVVPAITNSSFVDQDSMMMYLEFYNAINAQSDPIFVHAYVTPVNSTEKLEKYQVTGRKTPKELNTFVYTFDISTLLSGSYYLNIEIFNKENKIIASTEEKFFVSNSRIASPITTVQGEYSNYFSLDEKELDYYFGPMKYIATNTEMDFMGALKTFDEKKNFFLGFWERRRQSNSEEPVRPWLNYLEKIKYANQHYKASFKEGWKTDRGRVHIMLGPPNDIERFMSDNNLYPYEIWHYNKLETQSDVTFVFYEPIRANEEYPLLHSTLFGEYNNPRWRLDLQRRTGQQGNLDKDTMENGGFR